VPDKFRSTEAIDTENRYAHATSKDSMGKERNPKRMLNTCSKRESLNPKTKDIKRGNKKLLPILIKENYFSLSNTLTVTTLHRTKGSIFSF
jgi:hypothetical protein